MCVHGSTRILSSIWIFQHIIDSFQEIKVSFSFFSFFYLDMKYFVY